MRRANRRSFWPDGKSAAVSVTFDDARISQVETAVPILDEYGIRGTFFVLPTGVTRRLDEWKTALAAGHEVANHTLSHPCSGNFSWSRYNALEAYTLDRIEQELVAANDEIENLLGVTPTSFAYPCGQRFVGRGQELQSYVPLVARHFVAGRSWRDEVPNDPATCDLAQLNGIEFDGASWEALREWVDAAVASHSWLIFCGHDVGAAGHAVIPESLRRLSSYVRDRSEVIWTDTVTAIASYVRTVRDDGLVAGVR